MKLSIYDLLPVYLLLPFDFAILRSLALNGCSNVLLAQFLLHDLGC
jgi:hypothetical protein